MPFAPAELVLHAVEQMDGVSPLAVVTLPTLLRRARVQGLDPVADGIPFTSGDELALLEEFFRLPRAPDVDRPFRAPWSSSDPWQKPRYPAGGLQRLRKELAGLGRGLLQAKKDAAAGRASDEWRLTPTAGHEILHMRDTASKPVRIVDLAVWLGRERDVADLDELLAWFMSEFDPRQADLIGTVFLEDVPEYYRSVPFSPTPIDDSTVEALGSLPVAPTVSGTLADLVSSLEGRLTADGYQLPPGLVRRVLTAWLRGDLVVLVGQPGTGKTMFAGLLGRAMEAELDLEPPLLIPVRADFDESEFIGYERLDGSPQLREFATAILETDSPLEARVVVIEEFNLAAIETYMASVLVATQERERLVRLPAGGRAQLPIDTFIIATCNSFRDEPETRTRVSSPTKRRSTIITMPNVLGDLFDDDPDNAVLDLSIQLVLSEAKRVATRVSTSRSAQFDSLRTAALTGVTQLTDLSDEARTALHKVTGAILRTSIGRSWFTLGLLKDVVLEVVHAERNQADELVALGQAVADKIVHQVRGTHADVEELREACAFLPNADEIARLIDRMMDGPADELLPLL